jgi:hypothetical protein
VSKAAISIKASRRRVVTRARVAEGISIVHKNAQDRCHTMI